MIKSVRVVGKDPQLFYPLYTKLPCLGSASQNSGCTIDVEKTAVFRSPCSYPLASYSENLGQLHSLNTLLNET